MLQRLREWNRARIHARRTGLPGDSEADYARWVRAEDTIGESTRVGLLQRARHLAHGPRISIVMPVFDPNPAWLAAAIDSVRAQLYVNWELCIADDASTDPRIHDLLAQAAARDARIRVVRRADNGHICAASNTALAMATGPFVALLDHDDVLPEHALLHVAEAIARHPDADLLYSDEDKIDAANRRHGAHFKPDWNAELLRGQNYIAHLGVYRTALVRDVGGFRPGYEGAQDYDLAFRCIERSEPDRIVHIPHILYHWRTHARSTASGAAAKPYALDAGLRALQAHLQRTHVHADASIVDGRYHVAYRVAADALAVAVVVLDAGGSWSLRRTLRRIAGADTIHVLSTRARIRCGAHIAWHRSFEGLSPRACNAVIAGLEADVVVLLDSDCVPESWEALQKLVAHAMQPSAAVVGPRIVLRKHIVGTAHVARDGGLVACAEGWRARCIGYFGRGVLAQDVAALGRGCVVFQRHLFERVRGFDRNCTDLDAAMIDVTLRIASATRRNRWVPTVTCHRTPTPTQCRAPPIAAEPFSRRAFHALRAQRR